MHWTQRMWRTGTKGDCPPTPSSRSLNPSPSATRSSKVWSRHTTANRLSAPTAAPCGCGFRGKSTAALGAEIGWPVARYQGLLGRMDNMHKRQRPVPYPAGSPQRRQHIDYLMRTYRITYKAAVSQVASLNYLARNTPLPGERCGARTRKGTPCRCKAGRNGRCNFHGGLSTGPRTLAGKQKSATNLPKYPKGITSL